MTNWITRDAVKQICRDLGFDPEVVAYIQMNGQRITVSEYVRGPNGGLQLDHENRVKTRDKTLFIKDEPVEGL